MVTNISYYNDNSLSIVILNTIMLVVADIGMPNKHAQ
jgi:hypothetical protein